MPHAVIYAIPIPAVVAGIVFLALRTNRAASALALGAAFGAAQIGMVGWPAFPPNDATQKLFFAVMGAIGAGVLYSVVPRKIKLFGLPVDEFVLRGYLSMLTALLAFIVCVKIYAGSWQSIFIAMFGITFLWTYFDLMFKLLDGLAVAGVFWLAATGAAIGLVLAGNMIAGFLCASLAAGLGANIVLTWFKPACRLQRSAVLVVTAILLGELVSGCAYGDLPISSAVLLALAPNLAWVALLKPISRLRRWQQALICGALMLIPIGIAVGLVISQQPPLDM